MENDEGNLDQSKIKRRKHCNRSRVLNPFVNCEKRQGRTASKKSAATTAETNYFEEGLETFAQGALMGVGLSGAPTFLKQGIVNHLTTRKQKKELEQIVSELNEILGTDNLYDTELGTINLDSFDQETRDKVLELTAASDGIKNQLW